MKKNVWIFNHYAGNMYVNKGGRHYWIAKYLKQNGFKPVVFCCNAKHSDEKATYFKNDKLFHIHQAEEINIPFVFIKGRPYIGNGKQRILNMVDFYINIKRTAKILAKKHKKPDVIYASSVHPLTLLAGIQLAKYFGVKCVCEVRDLWPKSIVAYSDRWSEKSILIKLLYRGEKWLYQNADAVIFTMEGGKQYISDKGWDRGRGKIDLKKIFYINNGVDLEGFDYNAKKYVAEDGDLDDQTIFKVVYAGSIRKVNNLVLILKVAEMLKNTNVKFLIWGDGDELENLKNVAQTNKITNVTFKGNVNKRYIPSILIRADLNLLHWEEVDSLCQYGISSNKLFEYLAAGKPVLSTVKTGYSIIKKYECGLEVDEFTPASVSENIRCIISLQDNERDRMGKNARKSSMDFDFRKLTEKVAEVLTDNIL